VACKQIERTCNRYQKQRYQLGHRKHVTDLRAGPHPAIVDYGQDAVQERQNKESRKRIPGVRPELAAINHEQVGSGCRRCEAYQPKHPTHFNSHKTPESGARVEVGPAGLGKLRCHLRKAGHDDARRRPCQQYGPGAGPANKSRHVGRQSKYPTADDGVDHQRRQAPTPNGAYQSGLSSPRQDVVVPQLSAVSLENVGASVPLVQAHSKDGKIRTDWGL